jgi:anti-anti-sigma factor
MHTGTDRGPGLSLSTRTERAHVIATLSGELDIASAPVLREQLLGLLRPAASRLILDLSAVSYADASGLAVLVGTKRRAGLLGGSLRLAAPAPAVTRVLSLTGTNRQFDIFPTVQAAITSSPGGTHRPGSKAGPGTGIAARAAHITLGRAHTDRASRDADGGRAWRHADAGELRRATAAVLKHADAWRDADPRRQFTPSLQALARAYASASHAALTQAAQSLLLALARRPLTPSPVVAATASGLRRSLDPWSAPPEER